MVKQAIQNAEAVSVTSTPQDPKWSVLEKVAIHGDLSALSPEERIVYYTRVCESVGVNPITRPFDYLELDGKLVLYAKKDCTDQLRKIYKISINIVSREKLGDVYSVTARATTPDGRTDEAIGAVSLLKKEMVWDEKKINPKTGKPGAYVWTGKYVPLNPDEEANAVMKAETKAKRRVTLSIVGLGWLDESELETIEGAKKVVINDFPGHGDSAKSTRHSSASVPDAGEPPVTVVTEPSTVPTFSGVRKIRVLKKEKKSSPSGIPYAEIQAVDLVTGESLSLVTRDPTVLKALDGIEVGSEVGVQVELKNSHLVITAITAIEAVSAPAP